MATLRKNAARKNASRKNNTTIALEPNLRHAWLASLGLLVAARRESKAAAQRVVSKADTAIADARNAMKRAEADLRGGIEGVRDQVQPKVMKFSSDVEARLAPVLDKLGLKSKHKRAARKTRKPAAKKPALRRATRTPGKRVAKKASR
ncbi:hypothetical protein [Thermomonas carbonis]|uniref:Phasin family protein n=1 Tax=Thermomonas carbonis TaxID=1463158 RepID=A0A7G9SN69_9GAMM|nr:hypothetical protein [Thermomonas carbonis]QNN69294.1 hypothetical protein H9L16_11485 [Thermomonas carbonis]GHC05427.1 hypothetical protein GCM10010080_19050 [Thermomonas carbonis]